MRSPSTGRSPAQEEQPGGVAEEEQEVKALDSQGSLLAHAMEQARAPQHTPHLNGDHLSVFDDSTLSEVSEDEGRYICSMPLFSSLLTLICLWMSLTRSTWL